MTRAMKRAGLTGGAALILASLAMNAAAQLASLAQAMPEAWRCPGLPST